MKLRELLIEFPTAGAISSNAVASIPNPHIANSKPYKKKPGKIKSVNALDSSVSLFGAVGENQATTVIKR